MVTYDDIRRGLADLGLDAQSHVLVHSSYKSFGGVEGGPATVVRALAETVATLMMPSFTSDRTGIWDARAAFEGNAYPSERPPNWNDAPEPFTSDTPANKMIGVVSETFRREYAVVRSAQPLVSFIAYGALADELMRPGTEVDAVEPIRRLMEAGGDVLLIGVTHTNSTAIHLAEQLAGRELFVRHALTPDGVRAVRTGGCGEAFDGLQPYVEHLERRATVGMATLRCYALQPYVETARKLVERDAFALLCNECDRCRAHRSRIAI